MYDLIWASKVIRIVPHIPSTYLKVLMYSQYFLHLTYKDPALLLLPYLVLANRNSAVSDPVDTQCKVCDVKFSLEFFFQQVIMLKISRLWKLPFHLNFDQDPVAARQGSNKVLLGTGSTLMLSSVYYDGLDPYKLWAYAPCLQMLGWGSTQFPSGSAVEDLRLRVSIYLTQAQESSDQ